MAYELKLPDLGEGLQEAEIVSWNVGEGDHVVADQPLLSVETDKAGNKSFHKGKSRDRIDGAVAAAMAIGRASVGETAARSLTLEMITGRADGKLIFIGV